MNAPTNWPVEASPKDRHPTQRIFIARIENYVRIICINLATDYASKVAGQNDLKTTTHYEIKPTSYAAFECPEFRVFKGLNTNDRGSYKSRPYIIS